MKIEEWEKMFLKLRNTADNISEDVLLDKDEVKAFGELALLEKQIHYFLHKAWVEGV